MGQLLRKGTNYFRELSKNKLANLSVYLQVICVDSTKIQTILTACLTDFKRSVEDTYRALFLYKWKQTEKENVVTLDDSMLPQIVRIQTEGFETRRRNGVKRYSKKFKKTFYVILS